MSGEEKGLRLFCEGLDSPQPHLPPFPAPVGRTPPPPLRDLDSKSGTWPGVGVNTTVTVTGPLALGTQSCSLAHTHPHRTPLCPSTPGSRATLHPLTISIGFIHGDHALGLRTETERNIRGEGKGGNTGSELGRGRWGEKSSKRCFSRGAKEVFPGGPVAKTLTMQGARV